ncbi:MAG: hypothetical protein M1831_006536 [Alyxoria varia]|nr:MAG: hypothetical protein M1831_006536 [Alyxoria varia]
MTDTQSARPVRRILSLDGGGVRGLSSIIILEYILHQLKIEFKREVQIWEVFDMIGGTSTGGLRMSIKDCEDAYCKLSSDIFNPKRHRWDPRRTKDFLNANGKFDHTILEDLIKEKIKDSKLSEQSLLHDDRQDGCKVFVSAKRYEHAGANTVLRSYDPVRLPNRLQEHCKIWEAARATSAASTFFEPVAIGPESNRTKFIDAGIGQNNPIDLIETESKNIWPNDDRIIISIGTGTAPSGSFEGSIKTVVDRLREIATDSEQTTQRFIEHHWDQVQAKRLFRFNVPDLGSIGLEEYKQRPTITARSQGYLENDRKNREEIISCVSILAKGGLNGDPAPATTTIAIG